MKSNIDLLILKIRLTKRAIKVARYLVLTMGNVYQRFCGRPGSWLLGKLLLTINRMLYSHLDHLSDYKAELQKLTTTISVVDFLNKHSLDIHYLDTEYKKLTVIFVDGKLRVPRAQLSRMFKIKLSEMEPIPEENGEPTVCQGGKINARRNNKTSRKKAISQKEE